jgi:hypothetical protein
LRRRAALEDVSDMIGDAAIRFAHGDDKRGD